MGDRANLSQNGKQSLAGTRLNEFTERMLLYPGNPTSRPETRTAPHSCHPHPHMVRLPTRSPSHRATVAPPTKNATVVLNQSTQRVSRTFREDGVGGFRLPSHSRSWSVTLRGTRAAPRG